VPGITLLAVIVEFMKFGLVANWKSIIFSFPRREGLMNQKISYMLAQHATDSKAVIGRPQMRPKVCIYSTLLTTIYRSI
jgi:hypothetical protein